MIELKLEPVTKKMLNHVRTSARFLPVYDMPSDLAEAAVWEAGKVLLDHFGMPMVQYNQYRWFLREVSKVLRTQTGWDLATELEICLRKWTAWSLDGAILQALVRECFDRLDGMTAETIEERASSSKSETRMTIEARSPNDRHTRSLAPSIPYSLPGNDFSRGTKRVVTKWFQRGLSGHVLWLIGERLLGRLFPAAGASEGSN